MFTSKLTLLKLLKVLIFLANIIFFYNVIYYWDASKMFLNSHSRQVGKFGNDYGQFSNRAKTKDTKRFTDSSFGLQTKTVHGMIPKMTKVAADKSSFGLQTKTVHGMIPKMTKVAAEKLSFGLQNKTVHGMIPKMTKVAADKNSGAVNHTLQDNFQPITLDDIYISVKTCGKNHASRVKLILDTWYELAPHKITFVTDEEDPWLRKKVGQDRLVVTKCTQGHGIEALSCKMGIEFDGYLKNMKRWFCHVDDDTYVNVPQLVKLLRKYDYRKDWYIGKLSVNGPFYMKHSHVWFGTGNAGICVSQALAIKMKPIAGNGGFFNLSKELNRPDDVTFGYLSGILLKTNITNIKTMHSHCSIDRLGNIKVEELKDQVTLAYGAYNRIKLPGYYSEKEDWTRMKSLHCHLGFKNCSLKTKNATTRPKPKL